ncbi:MAG: SUMF1/EgtB/PvdO family nonheme iron enzyme [Bacteroidales bacterium]|nr:SUMF1/EgtB/PvdO family nonheme iron enzyme [Bacteroidales bacterium]
MKKKLLFAFLCLSTFAGMAQKVSNVSFVRQDKKVVVTYSLDAKADIRFQVSTDQGRHWSRYIQNYSGDAGKDVAPGKEKKIMLYDLPELQAVPFVLDTLLGISENDTMIRFRVEVDDGSVDIGVGEVTFRMMQVDGGTFMMGDTRPGALKHTYEASKPVHQVTVDTFYMSQFEVTQRLWMAVMDSNPSLSKSNDSLPVEQVSYNDAQVFIARLSQITGYRFRMPTEAEWEYAARGGRKSKGYVFPGCDGNPGAVAWYGMNSNNHTHPVGRLKPNEVGLYDMAGNVWEWCSDWYGPYTEEPQVNPRGPRSGENRILRGGCMNSPSWGCAVSDRSWYLPDHGYGFHGLRLVLDSVADPDDNW